MRWSSPPAMNSSGARPSFLKFTQVSWWPGVKLASTPSQTKRPGAGDVVALVDLLGLLLAQRVGERVVELLGRERHRAMAVGRVLEHREARP